MRLAFLGTGSAFSLERYNGAVVVDDHVLLDAGAPLLPHMARLSIDPGSIDAVFLTHFHGDHVLGLPPFLIYRAFRPSGPLTLVGPPDVQVKVDRLCHLAWGDEWPRYAKTIGLEYREATANGEVAGIRYESIKLDHAGLDCRGYRLHLDGKVLAYAGDTIASPALDELVERASVAITEATAPGASDVHTSWEEARMLAERHPQTRFLFNHVAWGAPPGAVDDLAVIDA